MNLILCEPHEVRDDGVVLLTDGRAAHVRTVLRSSVGDTVRIGIVDGPIGRGEIVAIDDGGDGGVTLRCDFDASAGAPVPPRPAVDLLLALPRPKVMRRLWAQLAALGAGRIILTNAERVERHYFDTHILDEATYRPLLIEGLQQACDTRMPRVSIHRQFRVLIEDELDTLSNDGARLVAHPHADADPPGRDTVSSPRALLAIGPEGGWNAFELTLLRRHRFEPISLGTRILRTDTACVALLALLHEKLRNHLTPAGRQMRS
jgi:16S rRNA (uracil1498-N3)-methyltransferase